MGVGAFVLVRALCAPNTPQFPPHTPHPTLPTLSTLQRYNTSAVSDLAVFGGPDLSIPIVASDTGEQVWGVEGVGCGVVGVERQGVMGWVRVSSCRLGHVRRLIASTHPVVVNSHTLHVPHFPHFPPHRQLPDHHHPVARLQHGARNPADAHTCVELQLHAGLPSAAGAAQAEQLVCD